MTTGVTAKFVFQDNHFVSNVGSRGCTGTLEGARANVRRPTGKADIVDLLKNKGSLNESGDVGMEERQDKSGMQNGWSLKGDETEWRRGGRGQQASLVNPGSLMRSVVLGDFYPPLAIVSFKVSDSCKFPNLLKYFPK